MHIAEHKTNKTKAYKMKICKQSAWNEPTKWGKKREKKRSLNVLVGKIW